MEKGSNNLLEIPISQIELKEAVYFSDTSLLGESLKKMQTEKLESVLVGDRENPKGLLKKQDFFQERFLKSDQENSWKEWPVSQIMATDLSSVSLDTTLSECIRTMNLKEVQVLPVCNDEGKMQFIVDAYDLFSLFKKVFFRDEDPYGKGFSWDVIYVGHSQKWQTANDFIFYTPLRNVIFEESLKLDYRTKIEEALQLMWKNQKSHVFFVEHETQLKGIFTLQNFLDKILDKNHLENLALASEDFMTPKSEVFFSKHNVAHAVFYMAANYGQDMVVLDNDDYPLALIGPLDILQFVNGLSISF